MLLRYFTTPVVLVFLALPALADPPPQPASSDPGAAAARASESLQPVTKPVPESDAPVRRFTPSEKVRADDAVSFPVDI